MNTIRIDNNWYSEFINLTEHDVTVVDPQLPGGYRTFTPSGNIARIEDESSIIERINHIDIFSIRSNVVVGLPPVEYIQILMGHGVDRKINTIPKYIYIVSRLVKQAVPDRCDCVFPYGLLRNKKGKVIGCKGFAY
jgi:hypothetical protein